MKKFIILNTKGGVAKSTTAMQIIVPYLHTHGEATVNLVEFDDENSDSLTFRNSTILNAKRVNVTGGDLDTKLTDCTVESGNLVVDVGGNKTTTYLLKSLKQTNMINLFDCAVIPLTDGEQDSLNAINVYRQIREISSDINIVFALGRVDKEMELDIQFFDFFGDEKGRINDNAGLIEDIDKTDRNIMIMHNSQSVKLSRVFGVTAWELAQGETEILTQKLKKHLSSKETDKAKKTAYRITIINKAKDFVEETIKPCFEVLDRIAK